MVQKNGPKVKFAKSLSINLFYWKELKLVQTVVKPLLEFDLIKRTKRSKVTTREQRAESRPEQSRKGPGVKSPDIYDLISVLL